MAAETVTGDVQPLKRSNSQDFIPPYMSELLVVLLGNSWSERSSAGNLLLGETKFNTEEEPDFVTVREQIKEKEIVLINTPDLLNPTISEDKLRERVELCVRLSDPGPHVFLLVLQPEDFTEEHRVRICRVLELFSDQSFDRSLVLISASREESSFENNLSFRDLIRECRYRYLFQKNLERSELLTRLSQILKENSREDLSGDGSEDSGLTMKPTLSDDEFQQERIQKEKENLRRKHLEDLKQIREQIELTEKQLKEKDECIHREQELRKKEESQKQEWRRKAEAAENKLQSEREQKVNAERKLELITKEMKKEREEDEKRRKKEESQKQEWKRKVEAAENKLRSEREQRENAERKLELTRREMKKEMNWQRDAWDKERKEIYERMLQESREVLEEERTRNRKLLEELYRKRKKWMYALFGLLFVIFSSLFYLFLSGGLT
ncbi:trichohyalin-like [Acanthochromis polyacanthus]|uniref:trichohyalin-like n=1 Tax=Acanthochromis polyacanthus TaxID=80966 RepID=UPI002234BA18|nr:trichohyalin-like [Acanthochromis polyacanthus]